MLAHPVVSTRNLTLSIRETLNPSPSRIGLMPLTASADAVQVMFVPCSLGMISLQRVAYGA